MPTCPVCKDEVAALKVAKVDGKKKKLCEDCYDRGVESDTIAQESESAVQSMMGFKGRR